jgi:hypothetical protein
LECFEAGKQTAGVLCQPTEQPILFNATEYFVYNETSELHGREVFVNKTLMPDFLLPSGYGARKWGNGIVEEVLKLTEETQKHEPSKGEAASYSSTSEFAQRKQAPNKNATPPASSAVGWFYLLGAIGLITLLISCRP